MCAPIGQFTAEFQRPIFPSSLVYLISYRKGFTDALPILYI
jgi:hypothetical protein